MDEASTFPDWLLSLGGGIDEADSAGDRDRLAQMLGECKSHLATANDRDAALLLYFESNIHGAYHRLDGDHRSWSWVLPHHQRQLFALRRAIDHPGFSLLPAIQRTQILTNTGNAFDHLGRTIEAIAVFNRAVQTRPRFGMAIGNRGLAGLTYARSLADLTDRGIAAAIAWLDLDDTRVSDIEWESPDPAPRTCFLENADAIASHVNIPHAFEHIAELQQPTEFPEDNAEYRAWTLKSRLFLNPLNAVSGLPGAAQDRLVLPTYTTGLHETPRFIAWFNQMVQEFVAARVLLFESLSEPHHFGDNGVTLVDTGENAVFSVAGEKLRLAFRSAYSLLDKIAGFLNGYLEIGLSDKQVDMRSIWLEKKPGDKHRTLRTKLVEKKNLPLRGLYWLSRDVLPDDAAPGDTDTGNPHAEDLRQLRHALEHRCLIIMREENSVKLGNVATVALPVFREQTMQLFELVRAGLMSLPAIVLFEERSKPKVGKIGKIVLPPYSATDKSAGD